MRAKWFLLAVLGLLAVSCMVNEPEQDVTMMTDAPKITATFGSNGPSTKVSMTESDGQSRLTFWEKGDEIAVFYHNTRALEYALEGDGGEPTGVFNYAGGVGAGLEFQGIYGVYPYGDDVSFDGTEVSLTLAAEQTWREGSFDPKANFMVAASKTNDLYFRNVGGYLVLQLYGEDISVKNVTVSGNGGEAISGPADVWVSETDAPVAEITAGTAGTSVTLVCAEPVKVGATADEATEFWFVLPPTWFEDGITVNVEMEGGAFSISTTQPLEVVRNQVCRMAELCVAVTEATFEAEVAWTYADDAEADHNLFSEEEGTTVYGREALPLGIDAAIAAKYGEELAGAAPVSIAVRIADVPAEGAEPAFENLADDATFSVGNLALKDGALVADFEDFEWDKVYEITYQYALSTCELTVTGTVTTTDRCREKVTLPIFEYTFVIGELDEETGFGYVEKEPVENSYYYWKSEDISAAVFSAYQSAGVIKADDFADVAAFRAAELYERVSYAGGSAWDWVWVLQKDLNLETRQHFTESVLKGDLFSSGVADADDPTLIIGNDLDRKITSYIGQEIEIPLRFNYREELPEPVILFKEDFENNFAEERMPGWTFFDADGDDFNWEFYDMTGVTEKRMTPYSGQCLLSSASYDNDSDEILYPDNWAVTPAITLSEVSNYLSFWVGPQDSNYPQDHYAVYITANDQPTADADCYDLLWEETITSSNYVQHVIKLDDDYRGKTVYIAFRHFDCYDWFMMNLDDIMITEYNPLPPYEPEMNQDETLIYGSSFDNDNQIAGWWMYDADEDDHCWGITDNYSHNETEYSLWSASYYYYGGALNPDNWLISPMITLGSETNHLRFWAMSHPEAGTYLDHYGVYVMEYTEDIDEIASALSADPLFEETASPSWHEIDVVIPDVFKGKDILVLFRHYDSYDKFSLFLDDFVVYSVASSSPSPAPAKPGAIARKKVAPKLAAPGMKKEDLPVLKYTPLPAWKK